MQTKNIVISLVVVVALGALGWSYMEKQEGGKDDDMNVETQVVGSAMPVPGSGVTEKVVESMPAAEGATAATAKEFSMTAYYDATGKWFSLKEMSVKKGDLVRVKITNTKGMHDFTIDEMGIKKELPLDQEAIVEFKADKVGDFVYYCSKPGHRAGGQWGTLKVTE